MLEKVKLALRLTTDAYNPEIEDLIAGAVADLGIAGILNDALDPLMVRAIITYCRANFGSPADYVRIKASYDEQKAQLQMASGYGLYGGDSGV